MWFTPILGVTSTELCFIQLFTKTTVLICALSCRSLQVLKVPHTAAGLCAHSCRGYPRTQLGLNLSYKQALALHQFILHEKPKLTSLEECLFIVHLLQDHGIKPWAPRTLKPGHKPWVYYKKKVFTQP